MANIVGVCGEIHGVLGKVELQFECEDLQLKQVFQLFEHLHVSVFMGIDFMTANNATVKFGELEITVPSYGKTSVSAKKVAAITIMSDQTCFAHPSHSEVVVPVRISGFSNDWS